MTRDIRVLPDGPRKWKVTSNGRKISGHRLKRTAVDRGVREGRKGEPAELRIHGKNGRIQEERTYGKKDPFPPPG